MCAISAIWMVNSGSSRATSLAEIQSGLKIQSSESAATDFAGFRFMLLAKMLYGKEMYWK